jgi:hypothetical protein
MRPFSVVSLAGATLCLTGGPGTDLRLAAFSPNATAPPGHGLMGGAAGGPGTGR